MSESNNSRLNRLENTLGIGERCACCGRFIDDDRERQRLAALSMEKFDYEYYASLFMDGGDETDPEDWRP
jgi:hypothetical protein